MTELKRYDHYVDACGSSCMMDFEKGEYVTAKDYYNDTEALKKKQARTGVECRAEMNEAYSDQIKALQQRNAELESAIKLEIKKSGGNLRLESALKAEEV